MNILRRSYEYELCNSVIHMTQAFVLLVSVHRTTQYKHCLRCLKEPQSRLMVFTIAGKEAPSQMTGEKVDTHLCLKKKYYILR